MGLPGIRTFVAATAKLGLFLGSLGLALVVGELLARRQPSNEPYPLVYVGDRQDRPSDNFVKDLHTGWRLRPGHLYGQTIDGRTGNYQSNAQGFRAATDFDPADPRPAITFLGDSFAYGIGVAQESTFAALVQQALPMNAIYNFAMPGVGFDQMWMSLRHQAAPFRPRLVIVAFIDDDFGRSQTAFRSRQGIGKPLFVLEADTLRAARVGERPNRVTRFLDAHSWLYHAAANAMQGAGRHWPIGAWWRLSAAVARAMTADARRIGAAILFVRLPLKEPPIDFGTFRDLMTELNAGFLDLNDPKLGVPPGLHFHGDSHINEAGHRYVAEALLKWIRANQPALSALAGAPR